MVCRIPNVVKKSGEASGGKKAGAGISSLGALVLMSALIFFVLRIIQKRRSLVASLILRPISWAVLVFVCIYAWKLIGCLGFSECYLCRNFSPEFLLDPSLVDPPTNDFTRLMDLHNFSFLMNNVVCHDDDLILLVLVHSHPNNFERRLTVRTTWGRVTSNKFKLLFLLGIPNSTVVQSRLNEENEASKDLVQGNFVDSYRNLTYKHVMALKWTKYFCPKAKYLLKADDDVFVNSPSFLNYVRGDLVPETQVMRCLPVYGGRAQRSARSKWRVTWSEYKYRHYPPYCQGFAVLYSADVAATLYAKTQISKYFWIDDVFVTGFMAFTANFTPSAFGKLMLERDHFRRFMHKNSDAFTYLLGPWNLREDEIRRLWEKALKAGGVSLAKAAGLPDS